MTERHPEWNERRAELQVALRRFAQVCDGDPLRFLCTVADLLETTTPKRPAAALNLGEADVMRQVGLAIVHL